MGKVIIIGAGPGDPELLTIKAARYLNLANIVISDRLVSKAILDQYTNPRAKIILAGKEGYARGSTSQSDINDLLLAYYQPGKLLVRIKGGDTAFYSNILDELHTLSQHNIPYEIVPGITAASGASAYCGIPLTARGYADSVRFITNYNKKNKPEQYWNELASTDDTLVCYMSGEHLSSMLHQLQQQGISKEKQIAVIEQATTPMQKTTIYGMDDLPLVSYNFCSPTLVIIGKVVALYADFQWKKNSESSKSYFDRAHNDIGVPYLHHNFHALEKGMSSPPKEYSFLQLPQLITI